MLYPIRWEVVIMYLMANRIISFFTEVFKLYNAKNPSGDIARLNDLLCAQLGVNENPYPVLDELLGKLIPKNNSGCME